MPQYFDSDPKAESRPMEVSCWAGEHLLHLTTDHGVFSYAELDDASQLLLNCLPPLHGRVLDLGCGYGFIGIAAKVKNPDIRLVQSDVNRRALALCETNCKRNGVESEIVESDGFAALSGSFDAVLLNPPIHAGKELCYRLYAETADHLAAGGALYLVIRKKHGAESTKQQLLQQGYRVEQLHGKKGLFVWRCTRDTAENSL